MLQVPGWGDIPGLVHGFFGRQGGVSTGPWAGLNLGRNVGDDPAAVATNWQRVEAAVPAVTIRTMRQVHGARVARVTGPDHDPGEADAMITDVPGVGLAILTADCVPILMVAPAARIALAVHAGWRGTLAGIVREAVHVLEAAFAVPPAAVHAALGPAIGGCCYEIEAEIGRGFSDRWGPFGEAWQSRGTHGRLDLRRVNRAILRTAGVPDHHVADIGPCTSCHGEAYFSHRGSGGRTGRQLSVIGFAA
jgi:hypothetical protein